MTIIDGIWFTIAFLIISIVLLVDPKSSSSGSVNNPVSSLFSSPSSGQTFIYRVSALLIALFFIVTVTLSFN